MDTRSCQSRQCTCKACCHKSKSDCSRTSKFCIESCKHQIQLQVYDTFGVPVPNTEFWVTLDLQKIGNQVLIQFPVINFQTGQFANDPNEPPNPGPPQFGYLYTAAGQLPEAYRPNQVANMAWVVPSDNGMNLPYFFLQPVDSLPTPLSGYILRISNAGEVTLQGAGSFGNSIAAGPQVMLPTTVSYLVFPVPQLAINTQLSTGLTNTTKFSSFGAIANGPL